MLGERGSSWLLDFGLAKRVARDDEGYDAARGPGHATTDKNRTAGTPRDAAPDVIAGAEAGPLATSRGRALRKR